MSSTIDKVNKLAAITGLSESIKKWVPDLSMEIHETLVRYLKKYMETEGDAAHDIVITQALTNGVMNGLEHVFGNMIDKVGESPQFKKTVVMALTGLKKRVENQIEEYRKEGIETHNSIVMRPSKESDTEWEMSKEEK